MRLLTASLPRHTPVRGTRTRTAWDQVTTHGVPATGLLPALLTVAACAWSTRPAQPEPAKLQATYRIVGWQSYRSHHDWGNSPYYRTEDAGAEYPIHILVREDGWACVVPRSVFALNPPQVGCSDWRTPRPGTRLTRIEPRF
jgi:hypothetical protein